MLRITAVVMCKTCHGDRVHFLAVEFEDLATGNSGWMKNPPEDIGKMCLTQQGILVIYDKCDKSP